MDPRNDLCPDCSGDNFGIDRRRFLRTAGAAAGAVLFATPHLLEAAPSPNSAAETAVKALYETLSDDQRKVVCFDWNHEDKVRGLLRTHVSNNWHVTKPSIRSEFYTKKQQDLIHDVFKG